VKRALVVGASGQVGHQIAAALGPGNVVGTYRANPPVRGITLDLSELVDRPGEARRLVREFDAGAVYCAAAMTHVDGCESAPEAAMRINCHAPAVLAGAAEDAGIPFVFFSTEYVFDGENGPYTEESASNPISAYGRSKWEGENAVRKAHPGALILRTTVVYGFDPAGKNFLYSLRRAALEKRPFRAPVDQVSTPTYNKDLAQAAIRLVRAKAAGVFNVCGPERLNRYDFAVAALQAMGLRDNILSGVTTQELAQIAPRPLTAGLLTAKLTRTLPDLKMHSVEQGVREWMAENPPAASQPQSERR
jgi:dTDP-4-dehydrorhamnose reductase